MGLCSPGVRAVAVPSAFNVCPGFGSAAARLRQVTNSSVTGNNLVTLFGKLLRQRVRPARLAHGFPVTMRYFQLPRLSMSILPPAGPDQVQRPGVSGPAGEAATVGPRRPHHSGAGAAARLDHGPEPLAHIEPWRQSPGRKRGGGGESSRSSSSSSSSGGRRRRREAPRAGGAAAAAAAAAASTPHNGYCCCCCCERGCRLGGAFRQRGSDDGVQTAAAASGRFQG